MNARAQDKGIAFLCEFESLIPSIVRSDPTRLRQILLNIVGNAIKFTEFGSVRLTIRCIGSNPSIMQFDVIDTGLGITEEQRSKLFQPFTQADNTTTRKYGGTGLGLTICKRLAESMGGDVRIAETEVNKGTRFRIEVEVGHVDGAVMLDASSVTLEPEDDPTPKRVASTDTSLDGCRVLLAEDGPDNQRLISFILRKAGASVTLAGDGQTAHDLAMAAFQNEQAFDVVLMDMQMPVLDGYDATALLRSKNYQGAIIALTAHAMEGDRNKCIDAGCNDYAKKPIDREQLIQQVASFFKGSTSAVMPTFAINAPVSAYQHNS
jgi:CheY-like chemotaxis protein